MLSPVSDNVVPVEFPHDISESMTPDEAFEVLVAFLDTDPDDDALCAAALTIGEPLIDWHWRVLAEAFVALLAQRSALRKMVSCCMFDPRVPDSLQDRIASYVTPEDNIGGMALG